MLSFTHTLISLPFGIYMQNPYLIFLAAFFFHIFADTLLHWNIYPTQFKKFPYGLVAIDVIGGLLVAWFLTKDQFFTMQVWAAIAGGNMPDVMHMLYEITPKKYKQKTPHLLQLFFNWHDNLQNETLSPTKGLFAQVALIGITLILITIR